MTNLLRKDSFKWSNEAQLTFDTLKIAMVSAPVLQLPNFVSCSLFRQMHLVLLWGQFCFKMGTLLLFFSKVFSQRMSMAFAYLRELYAVKRWRQYLLGQRFIIQTDQRSLKELLTQVIQTPEQQFYLAKLRGYDYEIQYKPGKTNVVVDALSRSVCPPHAMLLVLTVPQFVFLEDLKCEMALDPVCVSLKNSCAANPSAFPDYKVIDGLLLHRGRI